MILLSDHLSTNLIIQYSIVGVALLAAFSWMIWKITTKQKKSSNGCCGCDLADNCAKKKIIETKNSNLFRDCDTNQKMKR